MNKITLVFKDGQIESDFNQEEESSLLRKLQLNLIAMTFMAFIVLVLWINIDSVVLACICSGGICSMGFMYYYFIYKKQFKEYRNLLISGFGITGPIYQVVLRNSNLRISEQDILILEDAIFVLVFSLLITTSFSLNTGQFLLFMISRVLIRTQYQFNHLIIIVIAFSIIIVHNDYQKIRNARQVFLLKRYNNNQLDIIGNLEQPILLLKYQDDRQILDLHFMNRKFEQLLQNIDSIHFIRNCFFQKTTSLYTYLQKNISNISSLQCFRVKSVWSDYQIRLQAYQGQNLLIALEFQPIKKLNVLAQPYFYKSIVQYMHLNNFGRYRQEVIKNICGFILYRPKKCKFPVQQIEINQLILLIHPNIYETNVDAMTINSSKQLFIIFIYILYQSFEIDKLILIQTDNDQSDFK